MRYSLTLASLLLALSSALLAQQQPIRVAASTDLQPVLPAVLVAFQQMSGRAVQATYQASITSAAQIENGAAFDLFLSADLVFPQRLITEGLADTSYPIPYGSGTLVLWARKNSRFANPTFETLKDPQLRRVAIANPVTPYGRAAMETLTKLKLAESLRSKLVIAENVLQSAQFVDSGNAEIGFISMTAALTPRMRESGSYFLIPREYYPPIEEAAVILKRSKDPKGAHQLLDYLLSKPIQAHFAQNGLNPPRNNH